MANQFAKSIFGAGIRIWMPAMFFFLIDLPCMAQQVQWAKVYPLAKTDNIQCVTRDENHIYAGGNTRRNAPGSSYTKAILYKLGLNGDTVYVKDLGFTGNISSITTDFLGNIRINGLAMSLVSWDYPFAISATSDGFIFKVDTLRGIPSTCLIGKDSSLVVVGYRGRTGFPGETSMYFQRIQLDGTIDPFIELNPGHPNCRANRVEQLPNGHYLISGFVGSRVASYEVDSVGGNPIFHQWYQTPDLTNFSYGGVGRVGLQNWFVSGDGVNTFVSMYNNSKTKIWKKNENGILAPPQGMKDSTVVFGYSSGFYPYNYFYRFRSDSSLVWFFNMRDSLTQKGLPGGVDFFSYTYFTDESAVFAGTYYESGTTGNDPFFMRVANVGTPVTSIFKPKRGTLSNETLAPWPNPSGGTLYLKQHFDKAEVHFYTVSGREVQTDTVRFGQPIDISSFAPGLYLYRAVIDGKPFSGKVVKN
jgi:hypothetical protein